MRSQIPLSRLYGKYKATLETERGRQLAWLCPKKGCNYRFSSLAIVLFDLEISSLVQKMLGEKK